MLLSRTNTASEIYATRPDVASYRARQRPPAAILDADVRRRVGRLHGRLGGALGELRLLVGHRGRRLAHLGMRVLQQRPRLRRQRRQRRVRQARRTAQRDRADAERDAVAAVGLGAVLLGRGLAVRRARHDRVENRPERLVGLRGRAHRARGQRVVVFVLQVRLRVEVQVALVDGVVLDLPDRVDDVVKPRGKADLVEKASVERALVGRRRRMRRLALRKEKRGNIVFDENEENDVRSDGEQNQSGERENGIQGAPNHQSALDSTTKA